MHVPALIQKHEQSPRIGFLLSLWQLCSLFCRLLDAPLSDRDKKKIKNLSAMGYFSLEILIYRH